MGDTRDRLDESSVQILIQQVVALAAETTTLAVDLLKELDLTEPLVNVLWRLAPDAPAPSMRTLAATLNCDPSTVTFLTDRLEQRGLVERRPGPTDRRQKVVGLTRQGAVVRARFVETLTARSPLARLSPDEQRHLRALLTRAGADPSLFTCQAI
ncbi:MULTISPECIES: MarR family winged helix-turn-helix transcriptional regulator [Pseudofrankia]|uniref:MarR family winged helix-turn-helix transcriptional regulator n=1 Tax=Pseudofrankia TaxID=2994363 RepID=UPI000234D871|nr:MULTISPECIES: MarR family transcriptional regulator [Pseudofrankia]OHV31742.1 MarR family transcriptional regulator [Pseudofrankia sp. EUN1h]